MHYLYFIFAKQHLCLWYCWIISFDIRQNSYLEWINRRCCQRSCVQSNALVFCHKLDRSQLPNKSWTKLHKAEEHATQTTLNTGLLFDSAEFTAIYCWNCTTSMLNMRRREMLISHYWFPLISVWNVIKQSWITQQTRVISNLTSALPT